MTMQTNDGVLEVISGASRSGKTAYVKKRLNKARRAWAWDPEAQWCELPGWVKVTTRAQLLAWAQKPGAQRVAYVAGSDLKAEFDFWCGCVFYAGRFVGPLSCVAEEVADVTTTAKAPPAWGILVRRGLKRGISIFPISQRWSEADKTAFGNASAYVMFRQSSMDDVAYLARKTGVNAAELEKLRPLEWVRRNAYTGEIERDKLKF